MQINPEKKDVEIFDNGVFYIKVHFVMVPLTHFHTYEEVAAIAQMHNAANITKVEGLINIMFQNKDDARSFAAKVNER